MRDYRAAVDPRSDLFAATRDLPEHRLEVDDVLFGQGNGEHAEVAVLVEGRLRVDLDDLELAELTMPGTFVGEIGALLGTARTATVTALEPSTVRLIGDPAAFFTTHPEIGLELARQLAGRLHRLLAYLGDLRTQYAGTEGHLTMVDTVLGRLASRPPVVIDPGSDRSPDY